MKSTGQKGGMLFVATIIEQIITIDKDAQNRLDEADRFREACIRETREQIDAITRRMQAQAEQKLSAVELEERQRLSDEQSEIARHLEESLFRLQTQFDQTKDRLADELYHRVIG